MRWLNHVRHERLLQPTFAYQCGILTLRFRSAGISDHNDLGNKS